MLSLIFIEINKLIRRKKFLIGVILLLIISAFLFFMEAKFNADKGNTKANIEYQKNYVEKLKEESKIQSDNGKDAGISSGYLKIVEDTEKEIKHLETLLDPNISNKEKLEKNIEYYKERIKRYKFSSSMTEYYNGKILESNYYIDNNLNYNFENKINAIDALKGVLSMSSKIGLLIVVAIMTSDIVAGENKPATIKFMLVKPIARWKILCSKFIAAIVCINIVIVIIELLMAIIFGVIYGFGDLTLPTIVGTTYESIPPYLIRELKILVNPIVGSSYLISNGLFLLQLFFIQLLVVTATIAFSLLFSTIFEDNNVALTLPLIFIIFMQWIYKIKSGVKEDLVPPGFINKVIPFAFTTYGDSSGVIVGSINSDLGIAFVNLKFSILILLSWILICYFISHVIFTKKDVSV